MPFPETISVILPAHNEADNIPLLFEKIYQTMERHQLRGEVLFVDDGSTDGTGEVARQQLDKYPNLKIYSHKRNLGLTRALDTGFRHAEGQIIIFLPSDLQSNPEEDIPKLLAGFSDGCEVVVGWRQDRRESKKWGSKVYNFVSKLLFGVDVHDQNWIKAFRRDFAKGLSLRSDWHRFLVAIAVAKGYKVGEVMTNWYPRTYGKSKFGKKRIFNAMLDMLVLKVQIVYLESPIRFFGGMGLVLIVLGTLLGLMEIAFPSLWPGAFTMLTLQRLFLVGVLLIGVGVLMLAMGLVVEIVISHIDRVLQRHLDGQE